MTTKTASKTSSKSSPAPKAAEPSKPAPAPKAGKASKSAPQPAAAAQKASAKPAPKAPKGEHEVISADSKITVLAKENPRREGTMAHRTFKLYKTGMTVGAWRESCQTHDADPGYLHSDIRRGYISVK